MTVEPGLDERLRRWRLILGGGEAEGTSCSLSGSDIAIDGALTALYDAERGSGASGKDRTGNLGASAPYAARWLGDIRAYFPSSVVQVMHKDALDRLGIHRMGL